jgi:hypothetical protein
MDEESTITLEKITIWKFAFFIVLALFLYSTFSGGFSFGSGSGNGGGGSPTPTPTPTPTGDVIKSPSQPAAQAPSAYTDEDLTKLKTFNDCLGEKNVKIYGANWCGWTKKLVVDTLGGFDTASAIYVECTEEETLCSSEGISGYPTTKINGEVYNGARTIAAIAEVTGCPVPELTNL